MNVYESGGTVWVGSLTYASQQEAMEGAVLQEYNYIKTISFTI